MEGGRRSEVYEGVRNGTGRKSSATDSRMASGLSRPKNEK